jgi:hypothetical protein
VKTRPSGLANQRVWFFRELLNLLFRSNLAPISLISCFHCLLRLFPPYLDRSSMSGNEERRVKARHEITQYYERRKVVTRRELPRVDMTIEGEPNAARGEKS